MGSEGYPVQHRGIYHNLPTFDPALTGLTAIVTGANGISGFHTMRVLLQSPHRWTRVYAFSRRPPPPEMMALLPESHRARVRHVAVDFLEDHATIARALVDAGASADYVFFYSYLQPKPAPGAKARSYAEELIQVNGALLDNFLRALTVANITPRRFLLQTGAKSYGLHLGRGRTPAVESDPQPEYLEPNFYYHQERSLFAYCQAHKVSWNLVRPAWVLGAVTHVQMNALHPVAVYAAVQAQKGAPLHFPGDFDLWQHEAYHSTAMLTGYLSEWAVLEDKCRNQAFNSQDTGPMTWDRLYQELTRWFGVEQGIVPPEEDLEKFQVTMGKPGNQTPMGYGPRTVARRLFSLVNWAADPANRAAWQTLMTQSGGQLTHDPFVDIEANFTFGDAAFGQYGSLCMNKARRLGWTGFVDTMEAIFETYREMGLLGMVPRMKVDAANPLT